MGRNQTSALLFLLLFPLIISCTNGQLAGPTIGTANSVGEPKTTLPGDPNNSPTPTPVVRRELDVKEGGVLKYTATPGATPVPIAVRDAALAPNGDLFILADAFGEGNLRLYLLDHEDGSILSKLVLPTNSVNSMVVGNSGNLYVVVSETVMINQGLNEPLVPATKLSFIVVNTKIVKNLETLETFETLETLASGTIDAGLPTGTVGKHLLAQTKTEINGDKNDLITIGLYNPDPESDVVPFRQIVEKKSTGVAFEYSITIPSLGDLPTIKDVLALHADGETSFIAVVKTSLSTATNVVNIKFNSSAPVDYGSFGILPSQSLSDLDTWKTIFRNGFFTAAVAPPESPNLISYDYKLPYDPSAPQRPSSLVPLLAPSSPPPPIASSSQLLAINPGDRSDETFYLTKTSDTESLTLTLSSGQNFSHFNFSGPSQFKSLGVTGSEVTFLSDGSLFPALKSSFSSPPNHRWLILRESINSNAYLFKVSAEDVKELTLLR